MPQLIRLYLKSIVIGFALSLVFTASLVWLDVANLQHLFFNVRGGFIAGAVLFGFNGLLFSGVQFAVSIMAMSDSGGSRGKRVRVFQRPRQLRFVENTPGTSKIRSDRPR